MDFSEYSHGKAGPLDMSPPALLKCDEGRGSIGHRYEGSRDSVKVCAVVRRLREPALLVNSGERDATVTPARTN